MPTGYKVAGGADLDSLFMPGSGGVATGYKVAGGADLASVFQPYTLGAQVAATGYKIAGGADLSAQFQNINVPLQPLAASKSGDATGTHLTTATGPILVTTNSITVYVSGGTAPYSFSWAFIDGVTANGSGSQTRYWYRTLPPGTYVGTCRCTVTDNVGASVFVDVIVTTNHEYEPPV